MLKKALAADDLAGIDRDAILSGNQKRPSIYIEGFLKSSAILNSLDGGTVCLDLIGPIAPRADRHPASTTSSRWTALETMRRFKPIGYTSNPLVPGGFEVNRRKARVIQRDFAICESGMATALIAEIFRFEGSLHPDEPNDGQSTAEATLATVHYFSWLATAPADRRDLVGQNDAACP